MKIISSISTAVLAITFAACASAPTANQVLSSGNAPANEAANAPTNNAAVAPASDRSPTETLIALNTASKAKDTAAIKNLVSSGSLKLIEESAKEQNKSVDELLAEDKGAPFEKLPEMRNEKIHGDAATIEIRNEVTKEFDEVPFVKENGEWKIALDLIVQDLERKATDAMKEPKNNK
ncbi:MAG: hypothetical protein ACR2IA_06295 [Pyrinomonadaceae bacterium]